MRKYTEADHILMLDTLAACIEVGILPKHGGDCHRWIRDMVDRSRFKPKRRRRRLPSLNKP